MSTDGMRPGGGFTSADDQPLRIIAREDPPSSGANDFIVGGASAITAIGGLVFGIGMLLGWPIEVYGGGLAIGLIALGVAVRRWIIDRFPDVDAVERRPSEEEMDLAPISEITTVPRRSFLGRMVAGAAGIFGLGLLAPVVSLGPMPGDALRRTVWEPGRRLVTSDNVVVRPSALATGGVLTAWPEGAVGDETAAVVLIRLAGDPQDPTNADWVVEADVVAYSKICTHAGCPVALFRERENALFCPCHQSTFDAARGAVPTFGPAARALPQLPLGLDDDGNLIALGDFTEQVGPAFG